MTLLVLDDLSGPGRPFWFWTTFPVLDDPSSRGWPFCSWTTSLVMDNPYGLEQPFRSWTNLWVLDDPSGLGRLELETVRFLVHHQLPPLSMSRLGHCSKILVHCSFLACVDVSLVNWHATWCHCCGWFSTPQIVLHVMISLVNVLCRFVYWGDCYMSASGWSTSTHWLGAYK